MAKWRVWNKHPNGLTHKELFKEEMIVIPAGEFVLMDYEDAVNFRGQYFHPKRNAQGAPDPAGFKVIHLEPDGTTMAQAVPHMKEFICHIDGAKFPSQALLDNYLKQNYSEQTFKDEMLEEEIEKEKAQKRSPGRTTKDKTA